MSNMSAGQLGTMVGLVVGAAVAIAVTWGASTPAVIALGAETGVLPALPPLYPCGPGMPAALINSVLGVPFRLGGRDPASGGLDCYGLLQVLLREGLGLQFPAFVPGERSLLPLTQVWAQTGTHPTYWRGKVRPWDIVIWQDAEAAEALGWDTATTGMSLGHCGLVVSRQVLVSATIDLGVSLFDMDQIAAHYGRDVLALLRPYAVTKPAWRGTHA